MPERPTIQANDYISSLLSIVGTLHSMGEAVDFDQLQQFAEHQLSLPRPPGISDELDTKRNTDMAATVSLFAATRRAVEAHREWMEANTVFTEGVAAEKPELMKNKARRSEFGEPGAN